MPMLFSPRGVALIFLALGAPLDPAAGADRLPALGADLSQTSVSGISSGAAMAVQFHVAHSSIVAGVGVIAGAPYDCAEQSVGRATQNCMKPDALHPTPDAAHLKSIADGLARDGAVDDVGNLKKARVWLFSGRNDEIVAPAVMNVTHDWYALYAPGDNIAYRKDVDAGHAMVTESFGKNCPANAKPFVVDCDFDAAKALLEQIYGPLDAVGAQPDGALIEFDQNEFFADRNAYNHSLAETGRAYIPNACRTQSCRVHVALHGCAQHEAEVKDAFYAHAGYNRWADANRIIVLYPQTIARWGWGWPFYTFNWRWNPLACWDWWGYDNAEHHTKKGAQIAAIRAMVERLTAPR